MVGLEGLLVISGNCRRDSVKNIKQHARLDETLAIRAWHNMSISIKHGGAGRLIRWIRSLAAPDSDFGVEPTNHLYGIEVDRKTTTLKIHERQYKKILPSNHSAKLVSSLPTVSSVYIKTSRNWWLSSNQPPQLSSCSHCYLCSLCL